MAFWSRRATRVNALQQAFNVAYSASLQSILLESNQELPAALDAYKATLMGIENALATIDINAVQYAQEKSLLASIEDVRKQCNERISYIERQLFAPETVNHPYGVAAQPANDTQTDISIPTTSSPPKSQPKSSSSRSLVNRVAVGSRSSLVNAAHVSGSGFPGKLASPHTGHVATPARAPPPPVPPHSSASGASPTVATPVSAEDSMWSGFDWSPADSVSLFPAPAGPPPPPPPPAQPAPPVPVSPIITTPMPNIRAPLVTSPVASASGTQLSRQTPTATKSISSIRLAKDPVVDRKYQLREPRRSAERSRIDVTSNQHRRTASAEASRSAPLLGGSTNSTTSTPSPAATTSHLAAQVAQSQSRRTNRYVVMKSSNSIVSQRSGHSIAEAAQKAAQVTASRRARAQNDTNGVSVPANSANSAQTRRQSALHNQQSRTQARSRSAGISSRDPTSLATGNTNPLLPAFDQLSVRPTSPASISSTDSESQREAEWDTMAREKIKGLRGVDSAAAEQILAEIVLKGDPVHWDDIAGLDKAKASLKETVVYPFLRPDLFSGLREPALGMLLFGPPGTGKTMLARAVATESKSTFFSISASSLTSKYMGESEKLVRALFQLARALAPSIIFVDEIDSILTQRQGGEHEASRRIKNEFLVHWSDLQSAAAGRQTEDSNVRRVLVLGATNLPWAIDEAARRRFVRRQYIPLPEAETRHAHLKKLLSHQKHMLTDDDIQELVAKTEGYSGSDLTALAKDAAMGPLRELGDALLTTEQDQIRPICIGDFEDSMQTIKSSVGPDNLKAFDDWAKLYGSSGA